MASLEKKIKHISIADLDNLGNTQLGVMSGNDSDLGYPMWGGKDINGALTHWLAKDQPGQLTIVTLTGATTTSAAGILQHDAAGAVTGKAEIGALADVDIDSLADNHVLRWNLSTEMWENEAGALGTLDDAYDVDAGAATIDVDEGDVT